MWFFVYYTRSSFQLGHANPKVWHMQVSFDHNVALIYKPLRLCWTKNRWMKLEERINIIRIRNQVQPFTGTGVWIVQYYSLISLGKTCINSLPFSSVPLALHFVFLLSYLISTALCRLTTQWRVDEMTPYLSSSSWSKVMLLHPFVPCIPKKQS